jgi:hypothetical protein
VILLNVFGQSITQKSAANRMTFDVSSLPVRVYILCLKEEMGIKALGKVIKE